MLYLCCTKLGVTLVNPLFIGYYRAIYDKPVLAAFIFVLGCMRNIPQYIICFSVYVRQDVLIHNITILFR